MAILTDSGKVLGVRCVATRCFFTGDDGELLRERDRFWPRPGVVGKVMSFMDAMFVEPWPGLSSVLSGGLGKTRGWA